MMKRRQFIRLGAGGGFALLLPTGKLFPKAFFAPLATGLNDPSLENLFVNTVPNALDPGFILQPVGQANQRKFKIDVEPFIHDMGFTNIGTGVRLTPMLGYARNADRPTYPGKTFVERSGTPTQVKWRNQLGIGTNHLLPVDTSLHWAYSLPGYTQYSISQNGIPIVPHLHGGHSESASDGNPEFFFSPDYAVTGPQWIKKEYLYANDQPAGTIWYHDHTLGITRLNVYAGMAGFYIIRDGVDTGLAGNQLGLPVFPYEAAFAIQDKMFNSNGTLFYPAFQGDPFYADFITNQGIQLPANLFLGGGPTALAEFFGDHMIVNGKLWPKMAVEPRNYRLRFLNGCDSRFLVVEFYAVGPNATQTPPMGGTPLPFTVIGSDQSLVDEPRQVTRLVMETGARYDLIFNFSDWAGQRIIMKNLAGDSPFNFAYGDDLAAEDIFGDPINDPRRTDRIMAFDVSLGLGALGGPADVWNINTANFTPFGANVPVAAGEAIRTRRLGLFEGRDEFGRLQPLLGTAEPAKDYQDNSIFWPITPEYVNASLAYTDPAQTTRRPMEGAIAWHSPTTENPALNAVEDWHLFNVTADSHPIHLHLVHFEIRERFAIQWDSRTIGPDDPSGYEEDRAIPNALYNEPPEVADGTYLVEQPVVQHNSPQTGPFGSAFRIVNPTYGAAIDMTNEPEYVENAAKDIVTARPGEITVIRARFDKPGRYVWHCHILSHEDHEMMRVLHVGPLPATMNLQQAPALAGVNVQADCYPNPFRETTNFRVKLEKAAQLELHIFDQSGRKVQTLANGYYEAGPYTLPWNGQGGQLGKINSAIYSYLVLVDGQLVHSGQVIQS
ncbi:MAG: hypothetical protein C7N36_17265 [Bacteroidetes bacterium]|nr:MAG: hypothetical protein C7N36_17265 [Bacteroidota bacterium]